MPTSRSSTWKRSPIARLSNRRPPRPPASSTSSSTATWYGAREGPPASARAARCAASRCKRRRGDWYDVTEKLLDRYLPVEAQRMRAADLARNLQRGQRRGAEVPIKRPGAAAADNVPRARDGECGDRQPAGQRLEQYEPECLSPARQHEDVSRCVM